MPYVRRYRASTRRTVYRRAAPYRRRYPTRRKAPAVKRLARRVAANTRAAQGHLQRNLQVSGPLVSPTNQFPICFQVTNFGQGSNSALYQVNAAGALASVATFSAYDVVTQGFWANQNADIPDTGQYQALYSKLTFRINGNPNLDSTRIRIDLVKPKASALRYLSSSSTQPLVLPQALNCFQKLCQFNVINPTYFTVLKTRTVMINSAIQYDSNIGDPQMLSNSTTVNQKDIHMYVPINRTIYQSLSGTNFGPYNTAFANQIWCIISSDDGISSVGDSVEVSVIRHVVWRDTKGSAPL